jgi:hypothetical protein
MHRNSIAFLPAAVACAILSAHAATPSGTIARDSLVNSEIINRLSVGADITYMDRGFTDTHGVTSETEARIYGAYVGYDVMSWLTVFATFGGSQIKENETYWSSGTKWSVGVAPNLWVGEVRRPSFLAGKISLAAMGELSNYESSEEDVTADWREIAVALLVRYEVFEDAPWSADSVTSLRLSAGPILSKVKGDVDNSRENLSFHAKDSVGWMASVEWFVAPTFSLSGGMETFDHTSVSGSIRLHF